MSPGVRRWLFADQLGPHFLDDDNQPVLLVEARSVLRRRRFHRQKAHLVLSALRHRAAVREPQMRQPLQGLDRLGDLAELTAQEAARGSNAP